MGVIAKYKFNQDVYENFVPTFNNEFTVYTITDEIDTDGYTIRTIESDDLPTLMRFGQVSVSDESGATDKSLSLLEVLECNTSNINNMGNMFRYCSSLTSLNVSNFNIEKVTNMSYMFQFCSSLTSLDVSNFNTQKVTNMSSMFYGCSSLTSIDISNFNTQNVTTMSWMFNGCSSLTSLDVSNFNTENVTNIGSMFYNCSSLTSLDVSNFNTENVTNMSYMFNNCSSLTSLNVSNFNTQNVTTMQGMLQSCSSLTSLDVSNFNTQNVTNMSWMFRDCSSLTSLNVSNFNTQNVTDMIGVFQNCSSLTSLDVSNFNTQNVTDMSQMLSNTPLLTDIGAIYCDSSTINTLLPLITTSTTIYYHDATLSDLTTQDNITYEYYDISTVTLPYELNKLPNGVADYIDVVNGVYVQRVGVLYGGEIDEKVFWRHYSFDIYNDSPRGVAYMPFSVLSNPPINGSVYLSDKLIYNTSLTGNLSIYDASAMILVTLFNLPNNTEQGFNDWMVQNNPKILYELATPIYTPLTDEEKALLPLSSYENGHVHMSSDELRPSKFEFRAKSSNRMQLDMLETGHYYLNAPTGNVKLGDVDIDVTEMPCIINVSDISSKRMIIDGIGHNITVPQSDMVDGGYFSSVDGTFTTHQSMCYSPVYYEILPNAIYGLFGGMNMRIHLYDEGQSLIEAIDAPDASWTYFTTPSNTKYLRFSCNIYYKKDYVLISNPITLSKLPSHRIPTIFTQGMKFSVDFGYWEGSKEARAVTFRTTYATGNWDIVDAANINGGTGIVLNRIATMNHQYIVEDELDISTGKHIKRVEKIILDDSSVWEKVRTTGNTNHFHAKLSKRGKEQFSTNIINTRFIYNAGWGEVETVWINEYDGLIVNISADKCNTVEQFKEWLKENPITVYYELETPEISYLELPTNAPRTVADRTALQSLTWNGNLYAQVKPSPLSYPTTLSPSTQYTVFHNRKNYNGSVKTPMINLGGTEVSATGSRTVVTTPSTLAHNELQFIGGENTVEQVMVVHGDWTKEGKTVDYFEGLQSSVIGDKTLENLVGEPTEIWSNNVTDGGAVDYVSINDVVAGYGNRPKLPEVQVGTNVRSYGMTLQNLSSIKQFSINGAAHLESTPNSSMFKANTIYTRFVTITKNTLEGANENGQVAQLKHSVSGYTFFDDYQLKEGEVGTFKFVQTTPQNISIYTLFSAIRIFSVNTGGILEGYEIIVEGDYTNIDIPYFEGMKSVENPVYHSVGKNLFNIHNHEAFTNGNTISGITVTTNANGEAIFNGTAPNDKNVYFITNEIKEPILERGKTYFISDCACQVWYKDGTRTWKNTVTFDDTIDRIEPYIEILAGETVTDMVKRIQIEQGTQATEYEPYKENILSTAQGTVLRGVGSYKDAIGWNDGIIRRKCVEFTITGEEGYSISNITENTNTISCGVSWETLGLENKIPTNDNVNMPICDKLPTITGSGDTPHIRQDGNQPYSRTLMLWFDKTKFSTYTSQGINDYIKSIGGLTIVAPLADTGYEDVEITGGGNWNKIVLDGSEDWAYPGVDRNCYYQVQIKDGASGTNANNDAINCYSTQLQSYTPNTLWLNTEIDGICFNKDRHVGIRIQGINTVQELQEYLQQNPITLWYTVNLDNITNTDVLIFNHGTLYTTTDTHPSTFLDFSLKTTNRYAVKDFDKLKYTVLTEQPFYFNGIDYPTSSTGMTIIDVTGIADSSIYSDDTMITVVQDDGNYYADGVLTQFKGEKTFVKEFVRTSNDTYNTGMTLLEPLELNNMSRVGVYDYYNPITGEIIKNTSKITITGNEYYWDSYVNYITDTSHASYSPFVCLAQIPALPYNRATSHQSIVNNLGSDNTTMLWSKECNEIVIGVNGINLVVIRVPLDKMEENSPKGLQKFVQENPITLVYQLETPQIIQATPTYTYVSTRPENGNIVAQDTQIQAEYLNYDNEQSIISPRMLGDGDEIRWELGSQCYVYENDNEYIPLTEYNELFGANLQAQEYAQYAESVDGADIEVGVALKEKAVYEQTYVKYEDNVIYPETMENIDETNGVEVDYICGATWQNPNDLSDIRHLGELREDGQYDVTIRRSGDDEIRLLEGTTHISLDYDELPSSEFELTFFNNGGVEVGKYGDTAHVLEDCVENSKLASGTVYGQTLVNLFDLRAYDINAWEQSNTYKTFHFNNLKIGVEYIFYAPFKGVHSGRDTAVILKAGARYLYLAVADGHGDIKVTFTLEEGESLLFNNYQIWGSTLKIDYPEIILMEKQYYNDDLPYFEGIGSTVVNGFSSCGKNLIYNDLINPVHDDIVDMEIDRKTGWIEASLREPTTFIFYIFDLTKLPKMKYKLIYEFADNAKVYKGIELRRTDGTGNDYGFENFDNTDGKFNQIRLYLQTSTSTPTMYTKFRVMLVNDSLVDTTYEPYKSTNYTLPTPVTLCKVGDVCDTFDVVSGIETRNTYLLDTTILLTQNKPVGTSDSYPNVLGMTMETGQSIKLMNESMSTNGMKVYNEDVCEGAVPRKNEECIGYYYNQASKTMALKLIIKKQTLINAGYSADATGLVNWFNENPFTITAQLVTPITTQHTLIPSTTQTTFEPTFILPQPLRSVPNGICDRLYWDENKGHYCIEKRVDIFMVDNTYNYNIELQDSTMIGFYGALNVNKLGYDNGNIIYSDFGKYYAQGNTITGVEKLAKVGSGDLKIFINKSRLNTYDNNGFKEYLKTNPITLYIALKTPEIIDLPYLNEKVELPTQPKLYPIGYKAIHEKANPEIGLTIPYKVLNMPTQPTNLNFVMDIADYVLTWDDVKEARQYNIILNDEVIATVKEPQYNTGEEMYGYILVEANNEIGDNLSEELYIKTVPNAPAQLTVAHNPQTDYYDFEISFIDTSDIADYYTVMYKIDNGEWVINTIQNSELTTGEKHLWSFSIYEINESIEVWATATNDVGTNDILPSAIYYMSPTPQWTYRINSKDVFLRWLDESPYDTKYKLRYSYKSNGQFQYAYFEGDAAEIGKLYEAVLPLAEDDEITLALCIISEKENLYCKPVKASKPLDPNIVPPMNFNYHWLARGLIEFYWEDQYDVDVEYEYILESMKANETLWTQVNEIIPSEDVEGTGTVYRVEYQLEDLEQIRMKVRMKWAMNDTEWTETLTTVFIPVEGNPPTYIRRTQTAEGLLVEWEAQAYIDSYHIYVIDNETGEELQHLETSDNSILVDLDYSNSIEIAIYEISRFSGGIESDPTDAMVFTPTMFATDIDQRIYQPCAEEYPIEVSTVQKATKQAYVIHDVSYTPNVETEHEIGVSIATPFTISYHPMMVDVHQAGSRDEHTINAHIKTLDVRNEDLIRVMTFERITDVYDMDFRVYTPSVASYPINLEVSKVRIVCLGDSLTSGHPFYWAETGTGMIEASYPYQLSRRLKNQYEVINSGYG